MEVLRRCPLAIAQRLVHRAIAVSTAVLDRITKTMSVAPLLTNSLDNSKQKTSNLLSPAPPPYSWSVLGKVEGPAPPPSSKISWSFDLARNPLVSRCTHPLFNIVGPESFVLTSPCEEDQRCHSWHLGQLWYLTVLSAVEPLMLTNARAKFSKMKTDQQRISKQTPHVNGTVLSAWSAWCPAWTGPPADDP